MLRGTAAHRLVDLPLHEAARRVPAGVEADGARLSLHPGSPERGTLGPGAQRYRGQWAQGRRGGPLSVELAPLASGVTHLEVRLVGARGTGHAEALADAVHAVLEPRPAPPPARPPRPGRRRVTVAAAVALLVAAGAVRLLAAPAAVELDEAVAQFRAANPPAVEDSDPAPPLPPEPPPEPDESGAEQPEQTAPPPQQGPDPVPPEPAPPPAPEGAAAGSPEVGSAAAAPAETTPAPRRPEAGVYAYATAGHEQLNVPGSRHDYPERSHITVTHAGCGVVTRWQPLDERWDEIETCTEKDPPTVERLSSHRAFFGHRQRTDYLCEPGGPMWRAEPDATWTTRCADDETTVVTTGRTVGPEPVDVGGTVVTALRYRLDARVTGEASGTWSAERWVDPDTGLLVRLIARTDVESSSPMGRVRYQEEVRLDLTSLRPHR